MKKVRITIKKGSKGKKFLIFNSPEAFYVWANDPELQSSVKLDPSLGSSIFLRPGEVMEVEWLGCEFFQENKTTICIDQIRLAKSIKVNALGLNKVVGVYEGWVTKEIISFKSGGDEDIKRLRLGPRSNHKFDINELFLSRGIKDNDQREETIDQNNLH